MHDRTPIAITPSRAAATDEPRKAYDDAMADADKAYAAAMAEPDKAYAAAARAAAATL